MSRFDDGPSRPQQGGLTSPYLNEELFPQREGGAWELGAGAAASSPFQQIAEPETEAAFGEGPPAWNGASEAAAETPYAESEAEEYDDEAGDAYDHQEADESDPEGEDVDAYERNDVDGEEDDEAFADYTEDEDADLAKSGEVSESPYASEESPDDAEHEAITAFEQQFLQQLADDELDLPEEEEAEDFENDDEAEPDGAAFEAEAPPSGLEPAKIADVPFAPPPAGTVYWPVRTQNARAGEVSYRTAAGKYVGNSSRAFGAQRSGRHHVGVDLYANRGDPVIACADGVVVNFHRFLGETKALFVEHGDVVVNYGEVAPDSLARAGGLKKGDVVKAGQVIGYVGRLPKGSSMLHFETYRKGTKSNQRWPAGSSPPKDVLNPTKLLLHLKQSGIRGGSTVASTAGSPTRSMIEVVRDTARDLQAFQAALARGVRDESGLTNAIFFARHPERGGAKIRSDEESLVTEWIAIRDTFVRPALRGTPAPAPQPETMYEFGDNPFAKAEFESPPPAVLQAGGESVRKRSGDTPTVVLKWNEMPMSTRAVDVVIHLHGFGRCYNSVGPWKKIAPSGIFWADPSKKDSSPGRQTPTLGIVPRGYTPDGDIYSFPEVNSAARVRALIDQGLARLAKALGAPSVTARRLILTAHSGGGAALLSVLPHTDADEVHVFDALYGDPANLIAWANARIRRDRQSAPAGGGGAMRILYYGRGSTCRYSNAVANGIRSNLPDGSDLARRFRVEVTTVDHCRIPVVYGWRLLADVAADLPNTMPATPCPKPQPKPAKPQKEFGFESPYANGETGVSTTTGYQPQRAVEVALAQWERWGRGTKRERDADMQDALREYWMEGAGRNRAGADTAIADGSAWSAAFISYVMKKAGASRPAFQLSGGHYVYVAAAKAARLSGDRTKFQAFDITEARPQFGDLLCRDRQAGAGQPCGGTTYANVDSRDRKGQLKSKPTHCDLVIRVTADRVRVIGGNVSGPQCPNGGCTVNTREYKLDSNGFVVPDQTKCRLFALVKPPGAGPNSGGTGGSAVVPATVGAPSQSVVGTAIDAVRDTAALTTALSRGVREEGALTNAIFLARHPERDGAKIRADEKSLIAEWIAIRDSIVRPALRGEGAVRATGGRAASPTPTPATSGAPNGPFGVLVVNDPKYKFTYAFTGEDVLWLARMLVGEAGGHDNLANRAVVWAMFNRFAFFTHKVFPNFAAFIRRYSTTLQPILQSSGAAKRHLNNPDFVRIGDKTYPDTDIPQGQLRRHLMLQKRPWTDLPPAATALAENAVMGRVPNPGIGNASEFASTRIYYHDRNKTWPTDDQWRQFTKSFAKGKKWAWVGDIGGLDQKKSNAFFVDGRVETLPANAVRIELNP